MFDHVTVRVSDREASEACYATVLRTLGVEQTCNGDDLVEWDEFSTRRRASTRRSPPTPGSSRDGNDVEVVNHHR